MELLSELGKTPKEVEDMIMSENRLDVLQTMIKAAVTAKSFSDFQEKISK